MARSDDFDLPTVEAEEAAPRTLLLRVRGDVDAPTADGLAAVLDEELADDGFSRVLLDLTRVTLLATAGLTVLQQLRRRCRIQRMHLVLVGTGRPAVHRALLTSGLLPLFETRATLQAALAGRSSPARRPPTGALPASGPTPV